MSDRANETAPVRTGAASGSLAATKPLDYSHATPGPPTDLVAIPPNLWRVFLEGYASGFTIGVDRGRDLADEDAAAIHRYAVRVVQVMAGIDPYEVRQARAAGRHARAARPRSEAS